MWQAPIFAFVTTQWTPHRWQLLDSTKTFLRWLSLDSTKTFLLQGDFYMVSLSLFLSVAV
jgi:hypothetical protein